MNREVRLRLTWLGHWAQFGLFSLLKYLHRAVRATATFHENAFVRYHGLTQSATIWNRR